MAVDAFLSGKIGFLDLATILDVFLSKALVVDFSTIEAVCAIDQAAREQARQIVASHYVFKND